MKFKAVIFDLDGTLLDSLVGIAGSMNTLLEERGYPLHPLESYKYMVGDGLKELVRRALPGEWHTMFPAGNSKEKALDEMVQEYRRIYDEKWPVQSPPYEGIPGLLDTLGRHGVKMAVLSNKLDDFTKRMTWALLPGIGFELVLGARAGIPGKPDPAAALEIAAALKVNPQEIVFLGDTGIDMQTAVNAGMYPVGALWGFREAVELTNAGAQQLLVHPMDLVPLVV